MIEANIHSETITKFMSGTKVLSTTNVTQLIGTVNGFETLVKGVKIKASPGNSGTVFIGQAGITSNVSLATTGYPLSANETVSIPISDSSKLYAIAATANDILHWVMY